MRFSPPSTGGAGPRPRPHPHRVMPPGRYLHILVAVGATWGRRPLVSAQPETTQERGFGRFVAFVVRKRPDGVIARWESRAPRKHLRGAAPLGSTWWAPRDR